MPKDLDHYDVVKQAANATTMSQLKRARKDLIAYSEEYGYDPLVQKAGEQVETLMISLRRKENEANGIRKRQRQEG